MRWAQRFSRLSWGQVFKERPASDQEAGDHNVAQTVWHFVWGISPVLEGRFGPGTRRWPNEGVRWHGSRVQEAKIADLKGRRYESNGE